MTQIGDKLYKNDEVAMARYTDVANDCNTNQWIIIDKGEYYEVEALPKPTLDELKEAKKAALKAERDQKEVLPIEYNGNSFDYDDKARDRINAAIIALDMAGAEATLEWTTADNTNVIVTANDLRAVIAAVAVRSNALHEAYRLAKEEIAAATTKAEVEEITLNVSVQNTENSDK